MMLIEETTVPDGTLPVEDFKAHLRLGTGFGQDTAQDEVLAGFLRAAIGAVEARTGKVLITRSFGWSLSSWRNHDAQGLPLAPVMAINGVTIVARDGSETIAPSETYWLERDSQRPRLRATGSSLPAIPENGSVTIRFEAGFGPVWEVVPPDLRQAVMLLAAHYYEYRNETSLSDGCMPFGVTSLIERYRIMRIGAGGLR
ncbi:head-tail connector protein [uncultured Roseobacter sp.]|uniref:head-tail connector protein n=1 Tax=uncultured Roseobacter sp. TaxID=114847 RepID=UPI00262AD3F9|nr:head-tail connector protein [uncultured Roseobacter sp.]